MIIANSQLATPEPVTEYTVSQLSLVIKSLLEGKLSSVKIKGEVSGLKIHSSGHGYFTLKDEEAAIDAICWKGILARNSLRLQDGMQICCQGRVTSYPQRSKYQIIIEQFELSGEGSLLKMLEERKRRLHAEGLFDPQNKKPLPYLPQTIGIITSPTGAVIQDMRHRLEERVPCKVLLWPVNVQGQEASKQVIAAIQGFNTMPVTHRPQVLIVARGGGSIEDLWAFNDEELARAVAASCIPIISAVGHETDTTLIDYVADVRAPTPTAAAEIVLPPIQQVLDTLRSFHHRAHQLVRRHLQLHYFQFQNSIQRLRDPRYIIDAHTLRLDDYQERVLHLYQTIMQRNWLRLQQYTLRPPQHKLQELQQKLERYVLIVDNLAKQKLHHYQQQVFYTLKLLDSYSYSNVLKRGFAYTSSITDDNLPITSKQQALQETSLQLHFYDGSIKVIVNH